MNVLQILPELNVGGVERGTVDLAKYLAKEGHKSIVVSGGGRLVDMLNYPNLKHYKLPVYKKSPFTVLRMIPKVAWILKNEDINIIHARSRVPAIIAFFAYRKYVSQRNTANVNPVSFITTCHGYYNNPFFSRIMSCGKLVVVASHVIGRHMHENYGVPLDRIRLIPRGVDVKIFSYKEPDKKKTNDFTVGMISRLTPLKGHEVFLRAMSKVVRIYPKTRIIIAGNVMQGKEDYKKKLELLVKLLGIERHVEFSGLVKDVPSLMHKLDLLVSASNTTQETFGRVIIEAFACGTPVVATAIGGAVEIIDNNKDGILVPINQPQIMAEKIKVILKNRKLAVSLSKTARKKVEQKYSLDKMMISTLKLYKESNTIYKILIIKLSAVGDIILALPSLKAIREKFKNAKIYIVTSLVGRDILSRSGYVDEVIVCQKRNNNDLSLAYLWKFSRKIRSIIFDLSIDLQNNRKSHLLSYLSGACLRYGYKSKKWDLFLNRSVSQPKEALSPIEHQSFLLKSLDIKEIEGDINLNISGQDQEYIDKLLKQEWVKKNQHLVALSPFASNNWKTKILTESKYIELIDILTQYNIRVILTGDKSAKEHIYRLCKQSGSNPINFSGKTTLLQLAALFKRCKLVITPDSSPLHIAVAVNTPCVALFGPTDPSKHIPLFANVKVLRKDLSCGPCYNKKCTHVRCMQEIKIQDILAEVLKLL